LNQVFFFSFFFSLKTSQKLSVQKKIEKRSLWRITNFTVGNFVKKGCTTKKHVQTLNPNSRKESKAKLVGYV
jgi:hypothetical protein